MQMMEKLQIFPDGPLWYTKVVLFTDRWFPEKTHSTDPASPKHSISQRALLHGRLRIRHETLTCT